MAMLLNKMDLIASVCNNVPFGMIELVLRGIGREHFERLLNFIAVRIVLIIAFLQQAQQL